MPAAHDAGIITTLPVGHVKPASHGLHVAWPSSSWNVPSPHAVHSLLLALSAYVPALQFDGSSEPAKQKVPAAQSVQSALLLRPVTLLHVPSGHGCAEEAPATQKCPGMQSSHASWALPP